MSRGSSREDRGPAPSNREGQHYATLFRRLSEGAARCELVFSEAGEPIDYRLLEVNAAYENLLGLERRAATGRLATEVYRTTEAPHLREYHAVTVSGEPVRFETYCPPADKHLAISVIPLEGHRFATILHDLTERNRVQRALEHALTTLAETERIARLGSASYDVASGRLEASLQARRICGWPEQGPCPTLEELLLRIHPDDRSACTELAQLAKEQETPVDAELRLLGPDRTPRWIHVRLVPRRAHDTHQLAWLGTLQDITEQKLAEFERARLEERLYQTSKMEAVGRLAGGVAHDFNNILTGLTGYTEMVLSRLAPDDPMNADLAEIRGGIERATELTRQLLGFSRKQLVAPLVVEVNAIVERSRRLLARIIGEDVELGVSASPEPARVRIDPSQLEQVLVNLAVNARDAMVRGGKLTIETANVTLDEEFCRTHPQAHPGPWVVLSVTDSGTGMDAETLRHLFEPFFTTKPQTRGTGLGLATVYAIAQQNGGFVTVHSELGVGSVFRAYLPAVDEPAAELPRSTELPARGHETVLLVEDEALVRNLAQRVLERAGYRVLTAASGTEAISLCETYPEPVDLLLTDVVMPNMNGRDLGAQLGKLRPGLRVLFMSGYSEKVIEHHGGAERGFPLLRKPFTVERLLRAVRQALDVAGETFMAGG